MFELNSIIGFNSARRDNGGGAARQVEMFQRKEEIKFGREGEWCRSIGPGSMLGRFCN